MSEAINFGRAAAGRGATGEAFSIGRALSRAMSVFTQGFVQFVALTAIAYVPLVIVEIVVFGNPRAALAGRAIAPFIQIVVNSIATATCLFGAYQIMRGRAFTIGESLAVALGRFWAVLGVSLRGGLITFLLAMLLIVPGVMYACAIYVALPACVIERLGPGGSLRRSKALTKGYRWSIFGLLLLVVVAAALLGFGFGFVAVLLGGPFAGALAKILAQVLAGAFGSVLYAVVYHDLRADKEGLDIEQLASVFD